MSEKKTASLSTMLGKGEFAIIKDKKYKIKPIALKDVEEFMNDNLSLGSQLFSISDAEKRKQINRWLTGYCYDEENNAISLEIAMNNDWDIVDLKEFVKKLCDISG